MVLELTNRCNLSCVHCAVSEKGHPHHLQTGVMSTQSIVDLFSDMKETGAHFDTLILFWLGEPLLRHPRAARVVVRPDAHGRRRRERRRSSAAREHHADVQVRKRADGENGEALSRR